MASASLILSPRKAASCTFKGVGIHLRTNENLSRLLFIVPNKTGKFPMQISEMQMCATFLKIYHTFMQEYTETEGEQQSVKVPKDIQDIL